MTTQQALLSTMEKIAGLNPNEMLENLDLDLFESGLLDSLALVTLITEVESMIGRPVAISAIAPDEFLTLNRLTAAIDRQ